MSNSPLQIMRDIRNRVSDPANYQIRDMELAFRQETEVWVVRVKRKIDDRVLTMELDAPDSPPDDVDIARLILFLEI